MLQLVNISYLDASDTAPHASKAVHAGGKLLSVRVVGAHTADVTLTVNGETLLAKTGVGSATGTTFYPFKAPTTTDGATAIAGVAVPYIIPPGAVLSCVLANGTAAEAFSVVATLDN
jgi:hypothetical protein